MNTAEIVIREVQHDGCPEVFQFTGKGVGQSRKAAKLHSHREILSFDKTGRDVFRVGMPLTHLGYNLRDSWGGVPLIPELAIVPKQFRELREVNVSTKTLFDCLPVENEGVGRQLDAVSAHAVMYILHEGLRVLAGTLADQERRDELGVGIHRNENPLIAKLYRIALADMLGFLCQERPDFVALNPATLQLTHSLVQQFLAMLASDKEQTHDCVPVKSSEPFCAADRTALKQALNRTRCVLGLGKHRIPRQSCVRFAESGVAGCTAPALDAALTKVTKSLGSTVVTTNTRHIGLEFLAEQADNDFGSALRLDPRAEHPRLSVSADGGEFGLNAGVTGGPRTHNRRITNPALCLLSYRHHEGIHGLAPMNAPALYNLWWPSHSVHTGPPFPWIEHQKSFLACGVIAHHSKQCTYIGFIGSYGFQFRPGTNFLAVLICPDQFFRINHPGDGSVDAGQHVGNGHLVKLELTAAHAKST